MTKEVKNYIEQLQGLNRRMNEKLIKSKNKAQRKQLKKDVIPGHFKLEAVKNAEEIRIMFGYEQLQITITNVVKIITVIGIPLFTFLATIFEIMFIGG